MAKINSFVLSNAHCISSLCYSLICLIGYHIGIYFLPSSSSYTSLVTSVMVFFFFWSLLDFKILLGNNNVFVDWFDLFGFCRTCLLFVSVNEKFIVTSFFFSVIRVCRFIYSYSSSTLFPPSLFVSYIGL